MEKARRKSLTEILKTEKEWAREELIRDRIHEFKDKATRLHVANGSVFCPFCKARVGDEIHSETGYVSRWSILYDVEGDRSCDKCFHKVYRDEAMESLKIK